MLAFLTLLAQGDGSHRPSVEPAWSPLLPLIPIAVLFYFFMILPMRRERKQRTEMLATVEKGDRVVVNGAIIGTVLQVVKADEKDVEGELLLKIDENANVKMRVLRSSVTRVIKDKKEPKDGA